MKPKRSALDFIKDVVDAGERAIRHVEGMTQEKFLGDERTRDAVRMCLADIGEAANRAVVLDPTLKDEFPEFEADAAYAMRIILTHSYFEVDTSILWQTVNQSIPKIVDEAKKILQGRGAKKA